MKWMMLVGAISIATHATGCAGDVEEAGLEVDEPELTPSRMNLQQCYFNCGVGAAADYYDCDSNYPGAGFTECVNAANDRADACGSACFYSCYWGFGCE